MNDRQVRRFAELLDEIRRAHAETDRWKALTTEWRACAGQWKARFEEAEERAGDVEERLSVAVAVLEESVEARGAQAAGRP